MGHSTLQGTVQRQGYSTHATEYRLLIVDMDEFIKFYGDEAREGKAPRAKRRSGPNTFTSVQHNRSGGTVDLERKEEPTRPPIVAWSAIQEEEYRPKNWDKLKTAKTTTDRDDGWILFDRCGCILQVLASLCFLENNRTHKN